LSFYKQKDNSIVLFVYVVPRSSKTEVSGLYGDYLKIKLKSPPVDNVANEELIRFLSDKLKVPKSNIEIVSGHKQKKKTISINNCKAIIIDNLLHCHSHRSGNPAS
jgi:uncharacterized protein (TIGR00251 family)